MRRGGPTNSKLPRHLREGGCTRLTDYRRKYKIGIKADRPGKVPRLLGDKEVNCTLEHLLSPPAIGGEYSTDAPAKPLEAQVMSKKTIGVLLTKKGPSDSLTEKLKIVGITR